MGFRLTSFGRVKKKPVKRKRKKAVKRKRKKVVKRKKTVKRRKRVVKRKRRFGTEKTPGEQVPEKDLIPGKEYYWQFYAPTKEEYESFRNEFPTKGKGTYSHYWIHENLGWKYYVFKNVTRFFKTKEMGRHSQVLLGPDEELVEGRFKFYKTWKDSIPEKRKKQKEIMDAFDLLNEMAEKSPSKGTGSEIIEENIMDYLNKGTYRYIDSDPKTYDPVFYDKAYSGYFGRRKKKTVKRRKVTKRKKTVKRRKVIKRKKTVKRRKATKRKRVVKRKKRPYKYRKKKFIAKGLRNASEWQEFQKEMSGKGFSQKEVAAMYRQYLASKPNRFTQMVKSGNISGLTDEGGRIGKNFLYDELKRNARIQGRKELSNIIRGVGGASGIIKEGGSTKDVARYLSRMNKKKRNSKLVQAFIDSYSDYKDPKTDIFV